MSAIGPVEPGDGTHAWDTAGPETTPQTTPDITPGIPPERPPPAPYSHHLPRLHRADRSTTRTTGTSRTTRVTPTPRATLIILATALLLAGGGACLYATRPEPRQPDAPKPPFPAQAVEVTYLGTHTVPPDAPPRTFAFEVLLGTVSGPPVTVTRMSQPYAGISLTSTPRTPFRTEAGSARTIVVTMHVTECGNAPENAGLPFLDVTLRNTRAIQVQSFILGSRYARDLSQALQVACGNDSG